MANAIRIGWSAKLETGIAEVDAQHRYLVELIAALGEQYGGGAAVAEAQDILHELERYSVYHFATEEALMTEHGVGAAHLRHHCSAHQDFILLLQQVGRLAESSPDDVVDHLLAYLVKWLVFHICGEDMRMARAIGARRAGAPLPECDGGDLDLDGSLAAMVSELYDKLGARSLEVVSLNARLREELEHSRHLEAELRASGQRWKKALEASSEGVWDWDIAAGQVCYSTRPDGGGDAAGSETACGDAAWWGRVHPDDAKRMTDERQRCLAGKLPAFECEFRLRDDDGAYRWVLSKGMVIGRDAAGRPTRMIGTHQDITQRKRTEAAVARLAHFDALTELPNRVLFREHAEQAVAQARRRQERLALLYLDLDHFKPINDSHGHEVGDALLRQVAQRVLSCIRASDIACRQGGDEFLVLLTAVSGNAQATEIAARIVAEVANINEVNALSLHVTVSIGIAYFPDQGPDFESLVRIADAAMYQAKGAGGSRCMPVGTGRAQACQVV